MPAPKPACPVLLAIVGTVAATAIGSVALLRLRRGKRHAGGDSIEPRVMPGSAADIHIGR